MAELEYFVHLLIASLKYQSVYNATDWQRQFNAINFGAFFQPLIIRIQNHDLSNGGLLSRHKHIAWEDQSSWGDTLVFKALVVISHDGATAIFKSSVMPISAFWKNLNQYKVSKLHPDFLVEYAEANGLPVSLFLAAANKAEFTESETRLFNGLKAAKVEIYLPLN